MKIFLIIVALIVFIIVLFFAWAYLKVLLKRRINYVFSTLVKEGDLEQAQNCFQRTLDAAPLFLAYNQTLVNAAINLNEVESAQSVRNLHSFFDKIADIYLKRQPDSNFANIFAVGIKKRTNPQLARQCIAKAMRREPSWLLCSIGCMVTRDFDVCSSALMGRDALVKMPNIPKYADRRISAAISLAKTLEYAGSNTAAALCLQQCAKETASYPLSRNTEIDLTFCQAYFKQSLGDGLAAADMLAKTNTIDTYTPYLVLEAALTYLANHKDIKALKCINQLSKLTETDLPLWYTDGVKAYISVISYISGLYAQNKYEPDLSILDLHLKNLKDAANAYHDVKYMQILAADACLCAGQKRQALLYLERAEKLPWQPIEEITESSDLNIEEEETQATLAALILSLSTPHLSYFTSTEKAIWQLYMDLDQADDALALAQRTLRLDSSNSLLEEAWWQFKAHQASQKLGKHKVAQEYWDQALKSLENYEASNHVQGGLPIRLDKLFETLAKPRSFGAADYHLLKAEIAYWKKDAEQENFAQSLISLFSVIHEHPQNLSALRFLGQLAIKENQPTATAAFIFQSLQKCYTTVDDLHLLSKLKELCPQTDTQTDTTENP